MPNGKLHLLLFCTYVFIYCFCHFCCSLKASVISWFICYALGMQWLAKHVPDLQSQAGRAEQVTDTQYVTGYWRSCGCRGLESSGREESVARGALGIRLGTHISRCSWPWEWAKEVPFLGESDVFHLKFPGSGQEPGNLVKKRVFRSAAMLTLSIEETACAFSMAEAGFALFLAAAALVLITMWQSFQFRHRLCEICTLSSSE